MLPMLTVFDAGADPPNVCSKLRSDALTVIDPPVTTSLTGMTIGLSAKPTENLKPHANHKIEVTGTVSKTGGASSSSTTPGQTLAVESFKMVAATCP